MDPTQSIFHTRATRRVRHTCPNEECCEFLVEKATAQGEAWPVFYVENPQRGRANLQDLIDKAAEGEVREKALKCDACQTWKAVREEFCFDQWPNLLVCAFPRGGKVVSGRQTRNHEPIMCEDMLMINHHRFFLVALVEHVSTCEGSADRGHYVAWLRNRDKTSWHRADDADVEQRLWLDHTVRKKHLFLPVTRS